MNKKILIDCPLFSGIAPEDLPSALENLCARTVHFAKNQYIFRTEDPAGLIGIVLSGQVHIIREDYWGESSILALIDPGDIFGEAFACAALSQFPVSAVAIRNAEILLIDFSKIISPAITDNHINTLLTSNMLKILAQKNILLTQKLEHVNKKTIREKLLSYLSYLALQQGRSEITVPFNRQELANYLGTDRSALSREISSMQKDCIFEYKGSDFKLL